MVIVEGGQKITQTPDSNLNPKITKTQAPMLSQTSSSHPKEDPSPPIKKPSSPKEAILAVASRVAAQPLPCSDNDVWGVLTAISTNARKRSVGINILLTADEHFIGRVVEDVHFQIDSTAVSQRHCEIYRKKTPKEDVESPSGFCNVVFLKDKSTNGTYLNWERLKRGSSKVEAKLRHGDIISFAAPPQHEQAFAFVYREVQSYVSSSDANLLKRKAEDFGLEHKRVKGIGIGAPEGPISLDDFRSLQRSNTELRTQLENHVHTIDSLKNENRETLERCENEMKNMRESISKPYLDQLKGLSDLLDATKRELAEASKTSSEQNHALEDLNERFSTALQSCTEANEIIKSQKASIGELKIQLDEERDQRREEREKAGADLKASLQRVQFEAQEELKRVSDVSLRREREQQEVINKLQESERESSSLVESLRLKLEETRQKLVHSDNRVRQLEAQVSVELKASGFRKSRIEELEIELIKMRRELEQEKSAREEAWAKVSALELEISANMRDLDCERRRLKGARERIMLRETQLRSFYSTTEEIKMLFTKQQEQLKSMQRALEDEENDENTSLAGFSNEPAGIDGENQAGGMDVTGYRSCYTAAKPGPTISAQRRDQSGKAESSNDETCDTEKHDCDVRSQDDNNTQEAEFPADDGMVKAGFGSDIDGVDTAPAYEGEADGTERVPETDSLSIDCVKNADVHKSGNIGGGDTMQLDDDINMQETKHEVPLRCEDSHHSQLSNKEEEEDEKKAIDVIDGGGIRTQDLLTSENIGSWAWSAALSMYEDNEFPGNNERGAQMVTNDSNVLLVAESQSNPSVRVHSDNERQALSNMIGIMAPDIGEQFRSAVGNSPPKNHINISDSDSETDNECIEVPKNVRDADSGSGSDEETQADDQGGKKDDNEDEMMDKDDDDDDIKEDSVGASEKQEKEQMDSQELNEEEPLIIRKTRLQQKKQNEKQRY